MPMTISLITITHIYFHYEIYFTYKITNIKKRKLIRPTKESKNGNVPSLYCCKFELFLFLLPLILAVKNNFSTINFIIRISKHQKIIYHKSLCVKLLKMRKTHHHIVV